MASEPLEPISDPVQDRWATVALMISLLALGTAIAIVQAHVHVQRDFLATMGVALLGLVTGIVALVRSLRQPNRRLRAVPIAAIVFSAAALAGALALFHVH